MNWNKKVFTKADRKHMAVHGIRSREDMAMIRVMQKEQQAQIPADMPDWMRNRDTCQECKNIAVKMGVE